MVSGCGNVTRLPRLRSPISTGFARPALAKTASFVPRLAEAVIHQRLPQLVAIGIDIAAGDRTDHAAARIDDRVAIMRRTSALGVQAESADLGRTFHLMLYEKRACRRRRAYRA